MLEANLSKETIMLATGLSSTELEELLKEIND
jgi:hypothetical protein